MSLVKHDQIYSLFNQAYHYTNYCVNVSLVFKNVIITIDIIVLRNFMTLVK